MAISRPRSVPSALLRRARLTTTNGVSGTSRSVTHRTNAGAGISTCCPSSTPSGLDLGPPNFRLTNIAGKTLGFRRRGFSPLLSLLVSAFSLLHAPPVLTLELHCMDDAPLPLYYVEPEASVDGLSPLTFSAQRHIRPVSYYALFKGWLLPSQPPGCLRVFTSFHT